MINKQVEVGQVFDRLTVLEFIDISTVLCKCSCGNEKILDKSNLIKNQDPTRSCGCLLREMLIERNKKTKGILTKPYGHSAITRIMKNYRNGAKSRGYKFLLIRKDIEVLVNKPCYYCGESYSSTVKTECYDYDYNGIDRVDNTKDYTIDNCVTCCSFCNRAKYTHSKEHFIEKCKQISEFNN